MTTISKTNYLHGIACTRRLYLAHHDPDLGTGPTADLLRRFEQGNQVDEAARRHYPGGHHVHYDRRNPQRAIATTRHAIDHGATRLYQAAVQHDGVLIVADILDRLDNGDWHLTEVKMTTSAKDEHLDDIALQKHVLDGAGYPVQRATLLHLNAEHVHPDQGDLFTATDVTDQLATAHPVPDTLTRLKAALAAPTPPDVPLGRHCTDCPFRAHCWDGLTGRTIYDVPDLHHSTQKKLAAQGVLLARDIPSDFPLPTRAQDGLRRYRTNGVDIDHDALADLLDQLDYPLAFLDFETIAHPLPRYPGTRPFQQVPFQYSLHVISAPGEAPVHHEYLHVDDSDPRAALADALTRHVPTRGSVIAYYASFERRVLTTLAEDVPRHATALQSIANRLWDQLDVIKHAYRHHAFGPSNSIKKVLPVLVPHLRYAGMPVSNGLDAQLAFEKITRRDTDWRITEKNLRAYCELDTLAMVELHDHFNAIRSGAASPPPAATNPTPGGTQ